MSKSRGKFILVFSTLCGGLTALLFYNRVMDFPFRLVGAITLDWLTGGLVLLLGTLLFGLSIGVVTLRFRIVSSRNRIDFISILVFFAGGIISLYGGALLLMSIIGLAILILGAVFHIPVL
jgi:hypothetical protein